jgi:hypothetical protein
LIATIKAVRSDLFPHFDVTASPIPSEMPSHLERSTEFVEGIGEPQTACFFNEYPDMDPTGW